MIDPEQLHRHASIRLIHDKLEVDGLLEYSQDKGAFEIVLQDSGIFGNAQDMRILLTKQLLEKIELLPEGKLRLHY